MDPHTPPPIPPELVAWLELMFPDRLPDPNTPLPELHARCGEQRVIRRLRDHLKKQTDNVLEEPVLTP